MYIRPALTIFIQLSLLLGLLYPLGVTWLSHVLFPEQSSGSLIEKNHQVIGSAILGQDFSKPFYFLPRLSATTNSPYNPMASGGTNYAASNPKIVEDAKSRLSVLDIQPDQIVPTELVTYSGSGLDPNLSLSSALFQIPRIAALRQLPEDKIYALVMRVVQRNFYNGFRPLVNVLQLNLSLDELSKKDK